LVDQNAPPAGLIPIATPQLAGRRHLVLQRVGGHGAVIIANPA